MELISETATAEIRQGGCVLCDEKRFIAGDLICYRLLFHAFHYFLECTYGGEGHLYALGKRFSHAAFLFEAIVQGEVTPCTACDILEDLQNQ